MRQIVLVSGAPGSGKSTLAGPLARELSFPLLSKDTIKERLFDSLGHVDEDDLVSSRRLGGAAMELLWRVARDCPQAVLEANFRFRSEYERERALELSPHPVEVYCRVPASVAAERYSVRGASANHHPVHVLRATQAQALEEFLTPLRLGPVVEVDTTSPVDVSALAKEVRRLLPKDPS